MKDGSTFARLTSSWGCAFGSIHLYLISFAGRRDGRCWSVRTRYFRCSVLPVVIAFVSRPLTVSPLRALRTATFAAWIISFLQNIRRRPTLISSTSPTKTLLGSVLRTCTSRCFGSGTRTGSSWSILTGTFSRRGFFSSSRVWCSPSLASTTRPPARAAAATVPLTAADPTACAARARASLPPPTSRRRKADPTGSGAREGSNGRSPSCRPREWRRRTTAAAPWACPSRRARCSGIRPVGP